LPAPVELYAVADGDHSLKVTRRAEVAQDRVYDLAVDHIAQWLAKR
jgi:hypothetical protein